MFGAKVEYKEMTLPFIYDDNPEDLYAGMISIEASGVILGERKFCYASYVADLNYIDELAGLLRNGLGKTVKVIFKMKKGKVKDFKIDLDSLAEAFNDERFKKLEAAGWGLNDKSYKELAK